MLEVDELVEEVDVLEVDVELVLKLEDVLEVDELVELVDDEDDELVELVDVEVVVKPIKYLGMGSSYFSNHQQRCTGLYLSKNSSLIKGLNILCSLSVNLSITRAFLWIGQLHLSDIVFSHKSL